MRKWHDRYEEWRKMSDLQWALLALGVVIILGVVLFNWWQERKLRTEVSERFDEPQSDALMEEFHFDAEAILKDEIEPAQEYVDTVPIESVSIEPASAVSSDQETRIDTRPSEAAITENRISSSESINEVSQAIEEFERDMAAPFEEQQAEEPEAAGKEIEPSELFADIADDVASPAELAKEAGLDERLETQPTAKQPQHVAPTSAHTQLPADADQQIDLIAVLYLTKPATGAALREFLLTVADLDKPIYAHGLGFDGVWRLLTREQEGVEFTRATCSLQLADRSGFVSKISLGRFQHAVDGIGHKLGAQVEWQGSGDPWRFASELDQFCVEVDKMVGFNLVQGASGPFTGTKFRGLAEASGLALREDGAFHYEAESGAESGQSQFFITNHDTNPFNQEMLRTSVIRGIKFQLDIPRVQNCIEVFNHMVLMARQMENSLNATLVDDNQRPLGETQIEKIRQQLKVIHAKMVTRGVVPGSYSALRLFS
jgi:FtsZ-interacting cell division protein ZipA